MSAGAGIGVILRPEIDAARKELDEIDLIQKTLGVHRPVGLLEDDVAVEPGHPRRVWRQVLDRQIQEPFLLPQERSAADLDQHLRIARHEVEVVVEGEFHGDQRDVQAGVKRPVILQSAAISDRVEIGRDRIEHLCRSRTGQLAAPGRGAD